MDVIKVLLYILQPRNASWAFIKPFVRGVRLFRTEVVRILYFNRVYSQGLLFIYNNSTMPFPSLPSLTHHVKWSSMDIPSLPRLQIPGHKTAVRRRCGVILGELYPLTVPTNPLASIFWVFTFMLSFSIVHDHSCIFEPQICCLLEFVLSFN